MHSASGFVSFSWPNALIYVVISLNGFAHANRANTQENLDTSRFEDLRKGVIAEDEYYPEFVDALETVAMQSLHTLSLRGNVTLHFQSSFDNSSNPEGSDSFFLKGSYLHVPGARSLQLWDESNRTSPTDGEDRFVPCHIVASNGLVAVYVAPISVTKSTRRSAVLEVVQGTDRFSRNERFVRFLFFPTWIQSGDVIGLWRDGILMSSRTYSIFESPERFQLEGVKVERHISVDAFQRELRLERTLYEEERFVLTQIAWFSFGSQGPLLTKTELRQAGGFRLTATILDWEVINGTDLPTRSSIEYSSPQNQEYWHAEIRLTNIQTIDPNEASFKLPIENGAFAETHVAEVVEEFGQVIDFSNVGHVEALGFAMRADNKAELLSSDYVLENLTDSHARQPGVFTIESLALSLFGLILLAVGLHVAAISRRTDSTNGESLE